MTEALTTRADDSAAIMERVVIAGDLSKLTASERVAYYAAVCESVGLNPLTRPFDYLVLNGKMTLYATKTATDQLRSIKGISIDRAERDTSDPDYATWLVTGHDTAGRVDTEIGSVSTKGLAGEARANAIMKALTKGKRRLTLSLAGLGWLDETEVPSIPSAQAGVVDVETGEVHRQPEPPKPIAATIRARREALTTSEPGTTPAPAAPSPVVGPAGDGDHGEVIEGEVIEDQPVQCDGFSDQLGRCRKEAGHEGPHKNGEGVWPK